MLSKHTHILLFLFEVFQPAGSQPVIPTGSLARRSLEESWTQWSLKRGVESLPESITDYLQQSGRVQLHRDAPIKQLTPSASGWKVSVGVVVSRQSPWLEVVDCD